MDEDHFTSGAIRPSKAGKGSKKRPRDARYELPEDVQAATWAAISSHQRKLDAMSSPKSKNKRTKKRTKKVAK